MLVFIFCVLQIKLATTQFPDHVDLEKVGEIYLSGEKHNILKLSQHMVRDHFLDFMHRRVSAEIPSKRVFLDKNGFRHYWSSFQEKKTEIKETNILKAFNKVARRESDISGDNININSYKTNDDVEYETTDDKIEGTNKHTHKEAIENVLDATKHKHQPSPSAKVILNPSLRGGNKAPAKKEEKKTDNTEKTLAVTRFFCPFFGVITLSAYLD